MSGTPESTDSRIGSLAGILNGPPKPRPRLAPAPDLLPEPQPDAAASEASNEPPAVPTAKAPRRRPAAARSRQPQPSGEATKPTEKPTRADATAATTHRVVCRVPEDLHRQVAIRAAEARTSQAAVVLEAVEAAHVAGKLASQLSKSGEPQVSSPGGLFTGARPREWAAAKVTLDFRLHHADLATLDRLVAEYEATDRTTFITAALAYQFAGGS